MSDQKLPPRIRAKTDIPQGEYFIPKGHEGKLGLGYRYFFQCPTYSDDPHSIDISVYPRFALNETLFEPIWPKKRRRWIVEETGEDRVPEGGEFFLVDGPDSPIESVVKALDGHSIKRPIVTVREEVIEDD